MKINELLTKQNVLTKIVLDNGTESLSKELKIKVMRMRFALNKAKSQFDSDAQEFAKELMSDEYQTLMNKSDKTEEEQSKFKEMTDKINSDYSEYMIQKGNEEIDLNLDKLTEDEYFDILNINSANDVEVNGQKIKAADFMEAFYDIFIK